MMPAWLRVELGIAQLVQRAFQVIFEYIGHGHQVDILGAGEQIDHGLRAASAAADDAGAQALLFRHARTIHGLAIVNAVAPAVSRFLRDNVIGTPRVYYIRLQGWVNWRT